MTNSGSLFAIIDTYVNSKNMTEASSLIEQAFKEMSSKIVELLESGSDSDIGRMFLRKDIY